MAYTAIKVHNMGKRYRIGVEEEQHDTLFGLMKSWVTSPVKNYRRLKQLSTFDSDEDGDDIVWALRDVSFDVEQGEVIGVIGHNGAGKSTLLKILSRITEPSTGHAEIRGRVASLLEVGTGFHPELTGRENVYLNATIMGMSKAEVDRKFDEIVDFSGVRKFIDTPIKRYSSGMKVRLGFAVAAHLEPEVLLVDEVLAVGDLAFQKKCLGKMDEVSRGGRTVFFVSHNMGLIRSLCDRSILLEGGRLVMDGPTSDVIARYMAADTDEDMEGEVTWTPDDAPGDDAVRLLGVRLLDEAGDIRGTFDLVEPIRVEIEYEVREAVRGMRWVVQFKTQEGVIAFGSTDHKNRGSVTLEPGRYRVQCTIPARLLNEGRYHVKVHAGIPGVKQLVEGREFLSFMTEGGGHHGSHHNENWPGVVAPPLEWTDDQRIEHVPANL